MVVNLINQNPEQEAKIGLKVRIDRIMMHLSGVPASEKLFFVQHLGVMLKAGVSLVVALKTLSKQSSSKRFISIINDVSVSVEKGTSFAESLRPHEKVFGELFINMIDAGEISGKLESVLLQLFVQMKKSYKLAGKVKGAMMYPSVILLAMSGMGVAMMIFVVPKLTAMLRDFGAELPLPTKILIGTSDLLANNGILLLLGLIIAIALVQKILKTAKGKYYFDLAIINLPIFGPIVKKVNLANFSRTISSLLKTDIMIVKAFQITASTLGNSHYRAALNEVAEKIKKGTAINEVIAQYPKLFPPLVIQMVAIGEQTGEVAEILGELAEFYEEEVDQIMDTLPSIMEPVIILVLGGAVGAMAVAIIMPMYSMTSAV